MPTISLLCLICLIVDKRFALQDTMLCNFTTLNFPPVFRTSARTVLYMDAFRFEYYDLLDTTVSRIQYLAINVVLAFFLCIMRHHLSTWNTFAFCLIKLCETFFLLSSYSFLHVLIRND